MSERAPLLIAENPHGAVELRAALRRNGFGAVSGPLPRHHRPRRLGVRANGPQSPCGTWPVEGRGFRIALLSGEVETQ